MKADRYTVVTANFNNLASKLLACAELRLTFFVRNEPAYSDVCLIYIFFDEAGMENYLKGNYDDELVGEIIETPEPD